jgi:hypothetical protein
MKTSWWPLIACCIPGLAVATVIGASLLLAAPLFGISVSSPAFISLAVMAVACPLAKVVSVLVFRRQMACPVPGMCATNDACMKDRPDLPAIEAESTRLRQEIARLREASVDRGPEAGA